jgi:hypothetical protein
MVRTSTVEESPVIPNTRTTRRRPARETRTPPFVGGAGLSLDVWREPGGPTAPARGVRALFARLARFGWRTSPA